MELKQDGSCRFLDFDFRRIRGPKGVWRPHYPPKLKKRMALLRKLKEVSRRFESQPVERVIEIT